MAKPKGKSGKQTTSKTTTPVLVPQPNGRGALNSGGTPGNKGGGRPPNELRAAFRGGLETMREKVLELVERESAPCEECGGVKRAKDSDVIAAFDKFAKYGLGERKEVVAVDPELMTEFGAVVMQHVSDDAALEAIKEGWLAILADRFGS